MATEFMEKAVSWGHLRWYALERLWRGMRAPHPPCAELTVRSIVAGPSEIVVLSRGRFCFPGGVWRCLETLLAVTAWLGVVLASKRERPGCRYTSYNAQDSRLCMTKNSLARNVNSAIVEKP